MPSLTRLFFTPFPHCLLLLLALLLCLESATLAATDVRIASVKRINSNGGRVDWDKSGSNLIAYDKKGTNGYYDVYLMTPDGVDVLSLTAGKTTQLPGKHAGNPAWHPGGQLLVFQAERASFPNDSSATPGLGIGHDLWFASADGTHFWRMDTVTVGGYARPPGILHPHFSHGGTKLIWAEYVGSNGSFGEWRLKLANFAIVSGVPSVSNVQTFNPGNGQNLFETHNFAPDDSKFLYTSTQDTFLEIYSFDVNTQVSTRLTNDATAWDEHAHYTPDGQLIIWMSSHGLSTVNGTYPTDYWAMNANGGNKRRFSWFDLVGHQHYQQQGPEVAGDFDYSPDGTQMVGYVQVDVGGTSVADYNVLITFVRSDGATVQHLPTTAEMIYTAPVPSETDAGGHVPVELYAMDTEGVMITRLTFSQYTQIHAAVAPDRSMAVASRVVSDTNSNGVLDAYDKKDLWVFDFNKGTETKITSNYDAGLGGVDWGADSRSIYCSMTLTATDYDIYKISTDGSSIVPVTTTLLSQLAQPGTRKWVSDVSTSPDGQWLAFIFTPAQGTTGFRAKTQVCMSHIDGSQASLVTDGGPLAPGFLGSQAVGDLDPEMSPDNASIVFSRVTAAGFIGSNPSEDIISVRVADGTLTAISPAGQNAISGISDWSLDGRVMYSEWNATLPRVGPVLARTDGSLQRRLAWGINGSHFKWISPVWPSTPLTFMPLNTTQANLSFTAATGFTFQTEASIDLINWHSSGSAVNGTGAVIHYNVPTNTQPRAFLRQRINPISRDILAPGS
jgi:Tol biopolymer transport system component